MKGEGGRGLGVKSWRQGKQALTHLSLSLPVSIHGCWLSFMGVHLRSQVVILWVSFLLVGVCFHWGAVISVCGHASPFVGGWLHSWVFFSEWGCAIAGLVDACGHSWCSGVVGGAVVVGCHGHSFVVVGCHLSLWVV